MTQGPGDPDCPNCKGQGIVRAPEMDSHEGMHPPSYRRCSCILRRDIIANVERGMKGLSLAPTVKTSTLMKVFDKDFWITTQKTAFMAHLRHVAIRQPPTWYFKVVTDADLMTAWLASVAVGGKDILDPDAAIASLTHLTLVDLVGPPTLLIIRLGVKAARNVASPEVLLEALQVREHNGLPTWLWDTPEHPLAEGHISYDSSVGDYLSTWKHLTASSPISSSPSPVQPDTGGFQDFEMGDSSQPTQTGRRTLGGKGKK